MFDIVYSLRLRLPSRFLLLDKAVLTMEGVVKQPLSRPGHLRDGPAYAGELKRQPSATRGPSPAGRSATRRSTRRCIQDYPLQIHDLLDEMRAGELEIRFRHTGLENVTHRLDVITNRLVMALITIAIGVTSTAIGILVEGGRILAGVSVWGIPGFARLAALRRVAHLGHHPLRAALTARRSVPGALPVRPASL